ncbi:unnamed protein product [Xylocopa violacea]|uniref:Uncharacterized protein n=1 Tax=Xylocopa violacea TaxID=135666 RepID=A0ABP1N010_XYLVO
MLCKRSVTFARKFFRLQWNASFESATNCKIRKDAATLRILTTKNSKGCILQPARQTTIVLQMWEDSGLQNFPWTTSCP